MKKTILSIGLVVVCLVCIPSARLTFGQQTTVLKTLDEAVVKAKSNNDLIELYKDYLNGSGNWDGNTQLLILIEVQNRRDPSFDDSLRKLFQDYVKIEAKGLNSFPAYGEKRQSSRTGQILGYLGKRGGAENIEFILSQINYPLPMVRVAAIRGLGSNFFTKPENEQYISKVMPLLLDDNPDVVANTLGVLWTDSLITRNNAAVFLDEIIRAEEKLDPTKKRANDRIDQPLEKCFDHVLSAYREQLKKAYNKAVAGDKEKIDVLLQKIEERSDRKAKLKQKP